MKKIPIKLDLPCLFAVESIAEYLIESYNINDAISKFVNKEGFCLYNSETFNNYNFDLLELKNKVVSEILEILSCSFLHSINHTIKIIAIKKKIDFEIYPCESSIYKAIYLQYLYNDICLDPYRLSQLYNFCYKNAKSNNIHVLVSEDDNEFEIVYISPEFLYELENIIGEPLNLKINLFYEIN